jgi:dipeptidyl aminopeptidase/acylaminoacyl peptidase
MRLALIISLLALFASPQGPRATQLQQLWAEASTDTSGGLSGGGHSLPFVDWSTCDLAVRDLTTGRTKSCGIRTACTGTYPGHPTLSPDGQQIAYSESIPPDGSGVFVIDVAGGKPRLIREEKEFGLWMQTWRVTPRAKELVVTRMKDARQQEIGLVDVATGAYRNVFASTRGAMSMAVSDDAAILAHEEWNPDNLSARRVRLHLLETGKSAILSVPGDVYSPTWLGGRQLLFVKAEQTTRDLYTVTISDDGSTRGVPALLHKLPFEASAVGRTGDGTVLLRDESPNLRTQTGEIDWQQRTVRLGAPLELPPLTEARRAVFSPEGRRIALMLKGGSEIVRPGWLTPAVQPLNKPEIRAFPTTLTLRDEPAWLPGGDGLVVVHDEAGQGEGAGPAWSFWRIDLSSDRYERLGVAVAPGLVRLAGVRENLLFYKRTVYGTAPESFIEVFDLTARTARTLHKESGTIAEAAVSNDGRRIAFTVRGQGATAIHILDVLKGTPTLLNTPRYRATAREQFTWMPGDAELLMEGRFGEEQGIWTVPLDGRPPSRLNLDAKNVSEGRISPDGRRISFTVRGEARAKLWSLSGLK